MSAERFQTPQRLNPLTLVLGPLRTVRGWILPFVVALFVGGRNAGGMAGVGLLAVIVALGIVRQLAEVLRLRWWVSLGSFELRTGILQIETRSVPLERIQNVDLSQPILPRLLGLAEVTIETAGSGGGDIALRYITSADAHVLREMLATRTETVVESNRTNVLLASSTRELLIAGATANRLGALLVVAGVGWGWIVDLGVSLDDVIGGAGDVTRGATPALIGVVAVTAIVIVGWLVSIAGTLLRYHGFVLTEYGADLRREHGLLSKSSGVIPIRRVQAVRIERPWIRRFVHRATIVADSAGSKPAGTSTGTGVVAPIIRDSEIDEVNERVLGMDGPFENDLASVSPLAIRRGFVRASLPVVIAAAGLAVWDLPAGLVVVPGLGLAYWWARARYRAIGYRVNDRLLVARSGILSRRTWLVPVSKVQSAIVRSTLFQRRLGLATLSVDTAGPGSHKVTVIDLEAAGALAIAESLSASSARWGLVSDGV